MILVYPLLITLLLIMFVAVSSLFARERNAIWLVLAALFTFFNVSALCVPLISPSLRIGEWNWSGKIISILFSLCCLPLLRLAPGAIGLCLPNGGRAWLAAAIGICGMPLLSAVECALTGPQPFTLEHLAFEATLPGVDEELAFRGILFALLLRGFRAGQDRSDAVMLSAGIVTLLFWTEHVVLLSHGSPKSWKDQV